MKSVILIMLLSLIFFCFSLSSCEKGAIPKATDHKRVIISMSDSEEADEFDEEASYSKAMDDETEDSDNLYEESEEDIYDEDSGEYDEDDSNIEAMDEMEEESKPRVEKSEEIEDLSDQSEDVEDESLDTDDSNVGVEHEYQKAN